MADPISLHNKTYRSLKLQTVRLHMNIFVILQGQLYAANKTLEEYCERGARFVEGWNCSRRVAALLRREGRVLEDPAVQALKRCCLASSKGTALLGSPLPILQINYRNPNERSHFPESWMYQEEDIYMG